jgi:hypothetical protein
MNLKFEQPLSNLALSNQVFNMEAQLLAIVAELKVIKGIIVQTELVKAEDYNTAIVNAVDTILNEATKAGADIKMMKELVQEHLPRL